MLQLAYLEQHGEPCQSHSWLETFLDLTIDFLPFFVSSDLLNGAQEKCELPSLEGFPHCEGKMKVKACTQKHVATALFTPSVVILDYVENKLLD